MGYRVGKDGFILFDCRVNKKRYSGSTGQKNKRLAKIWVDDFKAQQRREDAENQTRLLPANVTCEVLLEQWLQHHGGSHARNVKADWKYYALPKLKGMKASNVTTSMLEEIRTAYLNKPSRVNQVGKVADRIRAKAVIAKKAGKPIKEIKPKVSVQVIPNHYE